jgi:hypothetical protein
MKAKDAIGLGLAVSMLLVLILSAATQQGREAKGEVCKRNLKGLATAIRNFDTEVWLNGATPLEQQTTHPSTTPVLFLKELSQHEAIQTRMLVCPTDTRHAAENFSTLNTNNLSYFLSALLGSSEDRRIIAGDRNIENNSTNAPFGAGVVRWLTIPTMHTNAGWLVLADTTAVRATNGMQLVEDVARANRTNRVIIP